MISTERPLLFLLLPDFLDPAVSDQTFVCPHCMAVEGLLSTYPKLRRELDVRYVPFARPRAAIIEVIGEEFQSCPVLVLPSSWETANELAKQSQGRHFFVGEHAIASAFAEFFGTSVMH